MMLLPNMTIAVVNECINRESFRGNWGAVAILGKLRDRLIDLETVVEVPDGYFEDGTARPWRRACIVKRLGDRLLRVRCEDNLETLLVPGYAVRQVTK